jgi:drug/metabolite transporter (DMT)-like permease
MTRPVNYPLGIACAALGALCFSTAGILMRTVTTDVWETVFWRCAIAAAGILVIVVVRYRGATLKALFRTGWPGVLSGFAMGYMTVVVCIAMQQTLVANVLACLALAPFFTALLARLVLRERIATVTWLAMALALGGILLVVANSLGAGALLGNLLALSMGVIYAVYLVTIRRARVVDMLPAALYALVAGALIALPLGLPFDLEWRELPLFLAFGLVQLCGGITLLTVASHHVPAATLSLIAMLETVAGPLWVWLGIGEAPGGLALAGALAVLVAALGNAVYGVRGLVARAPAA